MSLESHLVELERRHQAIEQAIADRKDASGRRRFETDRVETKKIIAQRRNRKIAAGKAAGDDALERSADKPVQRQILAITLRAPRAARHSARRVSSASRGACVCASSAKIVGVAKTRRAPRPPCARTSGEACASRSLRDRGRRPASPELPIAISTLRRNRAWPIRLIGPPANRWRNAASSRAASSPSGGDCEDRRARSAWLPRALPRICSTDRPPGNRRSHRCDCRSAPRNSGAIGPLCSIVR